MSIASLAIVFIALLFVTALVMFFIFEPANSETQPIQSLVSKVRPASTNPATSPVSVPSQPVLQKQNQLASLDAFTSLTIEL